MLNGLIRFSLQHRMVVLAGAALLLAVGMWQALRLPIDVFPNLNRPRVVVMTEASGMAPEEVEALITFPIETALNGATGVEQVRSSSGIGLSVIYVDFGWDTEIYDNRQVVTERLQLVQDKLPAGSKPTLAPISSIMGQILVYGMWSESGETSPMEVRTMADWVVRQQLLTIPGVSQVFTMGGERKQYQVLLDPDALRRFGVSVADVDKAVRESNLNATGGYLDERGGDELLVRGLGRIEDLEDLRKVVVTMRDNRPVTLADVARIELGPQVKRGDAAAYQKSAEGTVSGGDAVILTINKQPDADTRAIDSAIQDAMSELQVSLPEDIRIAPLYSQRSFIDRAIENVVEGLADGGVLVLLILFAFLLNFRTTFITLTAIPLSLLTTALVFTALGISVNTMTLGGIAVAIGELVDDAIVDVENIFRRLGEWRREREASPQGRHPTALTVIYRASVEVRSSVVYGTAIVVLVFLPLFALEGMEGQLFVPLACGYVFSLLASLVVSLTVTPVLSSLLLVGQRWWRAVLPLLALATSGLFSLWVVPRLSVWSGDRLELPGGVWLWTWLLWPVFGLAMWWLDGRFGKSSEEGGPLLSVVRGTAGAAIDFSTRHATLVIVGTSALLLVAGISLVRLERDFLPPFNEGTVQVNALLRPGTSLATSHRIGQTIDRALLEIPEVRSVARKTGRAELDEHAEGVNVSEIILQIDERANREAVIQRIRRTLDTVPGVVSSTEQPLAHLISHMLSGVKAQIGIKLYGDDLAVLRRKADEMKGRIADVPGMADVMIEQQQEIPQLRIELDRNAIMQNGLRPAEVMRLVQTAMLGEVAGQVLLGQRTFDLLVRLDEPFREDITRVGRLVIPLPAGGQVPLEAVAKVYRSSGPNTIKREQVRRRIVLQANVEQRGVVDVVRDVKRRLAGVELPPGYFLEYGGQFESQQSATQRLTLLFVVALLVIFLLLYTLFSSFNFALQVLVALPTAFLGAVAALVLTEQTLTVAALVGFISLCGIASRNGILLIHHYLYLVHREGRAFDREMIKRAGQERVAPVLMTALTSGIGLLPLALAAGEPGKEILYPIATVIVGGLLTSTLAEFFVRPALFWRFGRGAVEQLATGSGNAGVEHADCATQTGPCY